MIEIFAYGMLSSALLITLGVIMWRIMLERMDKRNGTEFKHGVYPQIRQSSLGLGIYHAFRLLAIAIIVSAVIGRFV